jgi:hypothetical protein
MTFPPNVLPMWLASDGSTILVMLMAERPMGRATGEAPFAWAPPVTHSDVLRSMLVRFLAPVHSDGVLLSTELAVERLGTCAKLR